MSAEIKIGDVVTLISGGPKMTVGEVDSEDKTADCYWFSSHENNGACHDWFPLAALAVR